MARDAEAVLLVFYFEFILQIGKEELTESKNFQLKRLIFMRIALF